MDSDFSLIKDKVDNGLFGCSMTWILEILPYLKKNKIYPTGISILSVMEK